MKNKCKSYTPEYRRKRHAERKMQAMIYLGGKCIDCPNSLDNSNSAIFEFHHLEGKDSAINRIFINRAWETVKSQLFGVVLICANCHNIRTAIESIPFNNNIK